MEINQIQMSLKSADSQERLRALTALRNYEPDVVVPLLKTKLDDPEFIVRSFVAMGLGRKQRPDAFTALLEIIQKDSDYNVRAEAANSLAMYGQPAIPYLLQMFQDNDNWLIRRSILAAIMDMEEPEALLKIALIGIAGSEPTVQEASVEGLGLLANSPQAQTALETLLSLVTEKSWRIRAGVAKGLRQFDNRPAKLALGELRQDEHHRVVAAAMEALL
jgi:HEAT repeat protein